MIIRMGGNVRTGMMKRYFTQSGTNGGGYYGNFAQEYAGKILHCTGNYVKYNEDWQGAPIEYVFEGKSPKNESAKFKT